MIADLKPYPEYKESRLAWLGHVPGHWKLIPNRALLRRRKLLVGKRHQSYQLLSLTKQGVVVRDISTGKGKFSEDMGTSQEVRNGDLVFCLFDVPETPRTVGLSRHDGMITGAYTVLECQSRGIAEYIELFYRAMDDRKLLSPLYSGLRNTIPPERFLGTKTPQPPPAEQAAIVRFLDSANGRLDRAIRAKRKVIALLNEQKQAIIHRAVTRGVNSSVPLKPSGIPWLGDVPKHWDVMTLGRVISDGPKNGISPPVSDQGTIASFSISAVRSGKVDIRAVDQKLVVGDKRNLEKAYGLLRGDMLLVRGNGNINFVGRAGVVEHDIPGRIYPDLLMRIRLNSRCLPEYLVALLNGPTGRDQIETAAKTAVGTFKVNNQQIRRLSFALPPVEEQRKILERIAADTGPTARAEHFAEAQMNLVLEYRTRLVADVVTGKLDVREAAARVPEKVALATTEDDVDLGIDAEAAEEEVAV